VSEAEERAGSSASALEQRLRAAVESSPSGLLMTDADGNIVLINREIERLSGYAQDELLGKSVDMLVPKRSRAAHPRFRESFQAQPEARSMGAGRELYALRKDGSEVPVEIGLSPLSTGQGLFVIASVVDITARKEAESEHQRMQERLREGQKLEALGTLAGGVAHDFNNVLAAIIGFAELAREACKDRPQVQSDLEELLRNAGRGKELIQRILRFSRRQDEQRSPLDLLQTVNEGVRLLRATLPATIEIKVRNPRELPLVLANSTAMQQVLLNLANNSAHAMPKGGVISIDLETSYLRDSVVRMHPGLHEGNYIVLSVKDNGTGMSDEVRARALEPFYTTKPAGEGSGLGLALVRGIVQDHGGALELSSAQGGGTTVTCMLPVYETEPDAAAVEAQATRAASATASARILLVDDEPALATAGERRLRILGYDAIGLTNPQQALSMLSEQDSAWDLLITDLTMPNMTGMELARLAHALKPGLPVILVSGYPPEASDDELTSRGIRCTLTKPVTAEELKDAIAAVLAMARDDKSR
jgi:PAS domain S-box-containing protein